MLTLLMNKGVVGAIRAAMSTDWILYPGIALNDETYPLSADKSLFFYFGGDCFVNN